MYYTDRNIDRTQLTELSTCQFIANNRNISFQGFTGSGKSFLACAIGREACKQGIRTRYIRIPDLLMEREDALEEKQGMLKLLKKYSNYKLLILDEWLILIPTEEEQPSYLSWLNAGMTRVQLYSALSTEMKNGIPVLVVGS